MSPEPNSTPSFWSRLGGAIVNVLVFLLILAVMAGVAAGIYYGAPYLYEKFIVPVETNTARLSEVENKQAADVDQLAVQITDLKTRLADLESRQTASDLELAETQGQVTTLDTAVQSHGETLKQLADMQAELDALSETADKHEALLLGENSPLAELQGQVMLSRVIELLSRSRLSLYQSNFGLARQDVQAARDLLQKIHDDMPAGQFANLQDVIDRLDLALGNLPDFPVIAANDVDIAWQLLVYGLTDLPTPTFTPRPATATPEPATATPEPTEEITPTATP
jgi:TolA-binding protein